ncbi:MAG: Gfo/Idh/MocA family oxidoreductase [Lentisphaerales bacterium]|nr:Gfo/Idh/MocA family oxidoreductase [Lentisphaerales bacterium]
MNKNIDRRNFVKAGAAITALSGLHSATAADKKDNDVLNVALVGCGGRGRGAAANALNADPNVRLVAIADVFPERLKMAEERLKNYGSRVAIPAKNKFSGFDAYTKVMALKEVDIVILTTPPHFRPLHIEAAVAAGKHIFAEKPLAVDVAGLKKVMKSVKECKEKGLTFVCGFCYRFDQKKQETIKHIQDGKIGEMVNIQCSYNTGGLWMYPRQDNWSDMEWQMRNWLYFTWLSGDHIVEQAIHNIDKMGWVTGDQKPEMVYGMGGRQTRVQEEYGHIYDHFSIQYKFANNLYANFTCRQQKGTDTSVSDIIVGTEGTADLMRHRIYDKNGKTIWRFKGGAMNMYDAEHVAIIKGIRTGKVVNNGDYSINSTAMGIMGRMSAYTGKRVTWDMLMNSKEDLSPAKYDLNAPIKVAEVAQPGITPFI